MGRGEQGPLRLVVDLREFRSVLPNLLDQVIYRLGGMEGVVNAHDFAQLRCNG